MRTVFCCAQRGRTGVLTLLGAVVADLKHADEQEGGFGSHAPAPPPAPAVVAAPPPAPRGPARKIRDILHEIADKVEQKSKNVRRPVLPPIIQLHRAHTLGRNYGPQPSR